MACELVTGLGEEPHISAEQIGLFNVALVGAGDYLLNTQDKLAATIPTANSITIGTGDVSMQGRHVTVPEPETLTIGSGTTGYNRIDLVVIRYTKDPVTGIEKTELDIIRGEATTGTPSEPSYTTGNIRTGGALLNELPIYRITISGITPQEPVLLLDNVLASLSQLQEGLAKLITTDRIQNGAVTNAKLADGSVNSAKIVDGGVASVDLANGAVTTAKIADGNVSLAKLASNSVNSSKIVDGSIVAADLANAAVTTAKIADKNITLAKLEQSLQNSISQTGVTNGWFWVKYPKNKYAIAFKRIEKANFAYKTGDPYEFFKETLPFAFTFGAASGGTASNRPTVIVGGGNYRIASLYCNEDSCNSTTVAISGKCNYSGTATLRVYLAVAGQYV